MKIKQLPLLSVMLLSGCGGHDEPSVTSNLSAGPAVEVKVLTVAPKLHTASEEIVGTIRSKQRSLVEAKVSGRVLQYLAVPGQMVKAGDTLATLDVQEIEAKVDQARAALEQAQREFDRQKQLITSGATTKQEFDAADARLKMSNAAVMEAETLLGYAKVTAPFDGVVTRKLADMGDLAMPGKPLAEVEAPAALRFETDLPEAVLDQVKLGQKMKIRLSGNSSTVEGTVGEISPVADPVSRTFLVKLDVSKTDGMRSGQFGRVAVPVGESSVITVPSSAVDKRGQMEVAFVAKDGIALMRLVKTGRTLNGDVEILSGLEEGEQIIAGQVAGLKDGQPVKVAP